jgi:8-oxo-dGTP pyrophosphatase MutT (NUDIX family)
LLLRYDEGFDGVEADYWVTPGGALERGESARAAAARELLEETGLDARIGAELWTREFELPPPLAPRRQREQFFRVGVTTTAPATVNHSAEPIREQRWWTVDELATTPNVVYPVDLAERLGDVLAAPGTGTQRT